MHLFPDWRGLSTTHPLLPVDEGGEVTKVTKTSTATINFDTLYLSDAGQYSCQVILTSSQLEGQHTVAAHYSIHFMSEFEWGGPDKNINHTR